MTYEKIVKQAFVHLQEDPNYPNFWETNLVADNEVDEIMMYAYEGLREIMNLTELNVTESTIPLYAHLEQEFDSEGNPVLDPDTGDPVYSKKNFLGYYDIPINRIQKIREIKWKPQPTLVTNGDTSYWKVGAYSNIKIVDAERMDLIAPDWRDARTTGVPTHAVLFSGNYDDMRMSSGANMARNGMKIKLYPTPEDIDENLQDLLGSLSGLQIELDEKRMSFNGGLMNDSGGDLVWGIDTDEDGVRDDISEGTDLGILVQLLTGEADLSQYGNYPVIRYVPDFEEDIFSQVDSLGNVSWFDLDTFIPKTLQFALRDYICYRCFLKEGEAIDDKKSMRYKGLFDKKISEYRADNMLFKRNIKTSDTNFGLGRHTNRDELTNSSYGNGFF